MTHPNSLQNLKKGNINTGYKKELTKNIQTDLVSLLANDSEKFKEQLALLKPRDYCEVYMQLMKLVLPKQLDVTVEERPTVEWAILEFVDSPQGTGGGKSDTDKPSHRND